VGTTVVLGLPLQTPAVGTVLLADDDAAFRGVLKGLLDGLADRVLEAGDGREALAVLAQDPVDLVLADMRMPGMDGSALLARLPATVPAIIVTGADVTPPPRAAGPRWMTERSVEPMALPCSSAEPGNRGSTAMSECNHG